MEWDKNGIEPHQKHQMNRKRIIIQPLSMIYAVPMQ